MNTDIRKKAKNNFGKDFFIFHVRTKLSYYKVFHTKLVAYKNEKDSNIHE